MSTEEKVAKARAEPVLIGSGAEKTAEVYSLDPVPELINTI